ncbi:MAG: hypothetical protein QM765_06835 [Myxococcales bacterium]
MHRHLPIIALLVGLSWALTACSSRQKVERIKMKEDPKSEGPAPTGVTKATADAYLKPGDFIFRTVNPKDPLSDKVTGAVIRHGQSTIDKVLFGVNELKRIASKSDADFNRATSEGDPNAVHLAIYLGAGENAEAYGSTPTNASVNVWPLFSDGRRGTAWRIFRHKDPAIAASVASIARRWANGRMTYLMPLQLFVRDASWNAAARERARAYSAAAELAGGPADYREMFCSQFAVAVLQAAVLGASGVTPVTPDAQLDALPREAKVDSLASPLRVFSEWQQSGAFVEVGRVVVE